MVNIIPLQEKWWFRAFLALIIFFVYQLFWVFSKVQTFDEDKMTLKAEVESLERKRDGLRMDILSKERDIVRLSKKSMQLESLIRDRVSLVDNGRKDDPIIYFITPTSFRPGQKADLTRLSYTLSHVPNLHWIVVEDADTTTKSVGKILTRSRLPFTHMNVKTRVDMKMNYSNPNWYLPRGVEQRNMALGWIRTQLSHAHSGAVYFGDDDNTYDLSLFNDIRSISLAGIWPVGIVGGLLVETPLLHPNATVRGFNAIWKPERPFPIDMAAFAVNLTLVLRYKDAGFSYKVPRGYQESHFLTGLNIRPVDLEPKAERCRKVYVWHTRTEKTPLSKKDIIRIGNITSSQFTALEAEALGIGLVM